MRALGRNWKVLIVMFTKGGNDYGELNSFRELSPKISDNLKIIQAGLDRIVYINNETEEDIKRYLDELKTQLMSTLEEDTIINIEF